MSFSLFKSSCALTLMLAVTFAVLSSTVRGQDSVSQTCAQLGFKPGTKGHADCVNQNSGGRVAPKPANPAPATKAAVPELTAAQREEKFWDDAKAIGNKEAYQGYLNSYPAGRYADLARASLARLSPTTVPSAVAKPANRSPGMVFKDCPDCPEMVAIPAGSFEMGGRGANQTPVHRVMLESFYMGKTEVTQGQWKGVMGSNPSWFKNCGDSCPVERVSWNDAKQFASRLSAKTGKTYRLPSESEWEYACRAGGREEYCGGSRVDDVAWYSLNSGRATHPVAGKQVNAFGLHDMSGNVWEWTEDCWTRNYANSPTDGSAWTAGDCFFRVARGGSWDDGGLSLGATNRNMTPAGNTVKDFGFRLARDN